MRHIKRAVRADLHRYKAFIEMQELETGAWRGVIEDGELVEEHDDSYDEERDYSEVDDLYGEQGSDDDDDEDEEEDSQPRSESDGRRGRGRGAGERPTLARQPAGAGARRRRRPARRGPRRSRSRSRLAVRLVEVGLVALPLFAVRLVEVGLLEVRLVEVGLVEVGIVARLEQRQEHRERIALVEEQRQEHGQRVAQQVVGQRLVRPLTLELVRLERLVEAAQGREPELTTHVRSA